MKIEDINYEIIKPDKEKTSSTIYSHFNIALVEAKKNLDNLEKNYKIIVSNGHIDENISILFSYDDFSYKIKKTNNDLFMSVLDDGKDKIIISSRQANNQSLRNIHSRVFNINYLNKTSLHKQLNSLCTLVRNEQRELFLKEHFYRIPKEVLRLSKRKNFYSELVNFILKNREAFENNSFAWDELNLISLFTDGEIPSIVLKYSSENKMEKNKL